ASPALPVPTGGALELVHSPLARTSQTAATVEDALARVGSGPARRPDPGFMEIHQGDWQGLHRDEITERYATQLAGWRRTPLEVWATGGESLRQVEARVRPALAAVLARLAAAGPPGSHDRPQVAGYGDPRPSHPWTIVVGHDGVFKVVLLTLF